MAIKLDPEEVEAHLYRLGYCNITKKQLEAFFKDLNELIKHDQRMLRTCKLPSKVSENSSVESSPHTLRTYNASSPSENRNGHVERHKSDHSPCTGSLAYNIQSDDSCSTSYVSHSTAVPETAEDTNDSLHLTEQRTFQTPSPIKSPQVPVKTKTSRLKRILKCKQCLFGKRKKSANVSVNAETSVEALRAYNSSSSPSGNESSLVERYKRDQSPCRRSLAYNVPSGDSSNTSYMSHSTGVPDSPGNSKKYINLSKQRNSRKTRPVKNSQPGKPRNSYDSCSTSHSTAPADPADTIKYINLSKQRRPQKMRPMQEIQDHGKPRNFYDSCGRLYDTSSSTALPDTVGDTKESIHLSRQRKSQKTRPLEDLKQPAKSSNSYDSCSTSYASHTTASPEPAGDSKKLVQFLNQRGSQKTRSIKDPQEPVEPRKAFIMPWNAQQPGQQAGGTKKRCDPVKRYHYYLNIWRQHKFPGEYSHSNVRWHIREKMLHEDPSPCLI